MDITTKTIDELKVIAYDLLVSLEQTQANLKIVNEQIQKKMNEPKPVSDESNS
jgi:hypothetical protein